MIVALLPAVAGRVALCLLVLVALIGFAVAVAWPLREERDPWQGKK